MYNSPQQVKIVCVLYFTDIAPIGGKTLTKTTGGISGSAAVDCDHSWCVLLCLFVCLFV